MVWTDVSARASVSCERVAARADVMGMTVRCSSSVGVTKTDLPEYKGPFEVVPDMDGATLGTKDRAMTDDVVVRAIPVYSVENASGGNTVTIGGLISYG